MKRYSGALICAAMLSGCAGKDFSPTMEADPALFGGEGIALVNTLLLAYEYAPPDKTPKAPARALCELTLPSFHEEDVYAYRRYTGRQAKTKQVEAFKCLTLRPAPTTAEIETHLDAGFALTDLYCDNFFRRVALSSNGRNFVRNSVNDAGAAAAAIAGLAKAGSGVTGGIGAFFGLLDASIRNYDDAFLVAKDLPGLETAVFKAQDAYKAKVDPAKIRSYSQATSVIIRYATHCSWTGMRGLISEKLQDKPSDPADVANYIENMMNAAEKVRKAAEPKPKTGDQTKVGEVTKTTPPAPNAVPSLN